MPEMNDYQDVLDTACDEADQTELFAEEVEDRYNAKAVSSASTAGSATGCWGTLSSACTLF